MGTMGSELTCGSNFAEADDFIAKASSFIVYAIYDSDIESPSIIQMFANRHSADLFAKTLNDYEATNPYPDRFADLSDEQEQEFIEWKERHPCKQFCATPPFVVCEMTVLGSLP